VDVGIIDVEPLGSAIKVSELDLGEVGCKDWIKIVFSDGLWY
jgi:hypothetical protein